jgi:hypothetical protein
MEAKMKLTKTIVVLFAVIIATAACQKAQQEEPVPQQVEITEPIKQPQTDGYEFVGGYPTDATIQKAYDQLDTQRATQAYIDFMPLASQNSIFESSINDYGLTKPGDVGIYTQPGEGKSGAIGLTYNTESIYATVYTDLKTDGPTVIESPPNVLGLVDDGWMRFITDIGNAGPDKGKGGKYLLLPPGYNGEVPEGYFVFECPTYRNWVMVRGFVQDTGTGDDAIAYYKKNFKVYSLAKGPRKDVKYITLSFKGGDTTHPRNISYFNLIDKIVQSESSSAFTPYELGLLKAIGIEKGKPFAPDERMKKMLAEGVKIGDAIAKANAYSHREPTVRIYPDRKYETIFLGGSHEFKDGDTMLLDARTLFHYEAIVVTPAMAREMVGVGSQYLCTYRDAGNNFLMGDHNYKMHLPAGIPAKDFWSVTAYHPDTRSLLQNGQPKPSVSTYDEPRFNEDGSIDIYFGSEAPEGFEKNWVKTIPGEGWFIYIRLYGPLEPFFAQTWKPDDIVKVK